MDKYTNLEHLSVVANVGISMLDTTGEVLFESSIHSTTSNLLKFLYAKLDCEESCRIAFLYSCYQSRRFGGRYVFYAPSGLTYCASYLLDNKGEMHSGIIAGPFLMTDYEDYISFDIKERISLTKEEIEQLLNDIATVPYITPKQAHAVSEHLYYVAKTYYSQNDMIETIPIQTDALSTVYSIENEDDLFSAINRGDIHTANVVLADIIKQILFYYGGNIEVLRSRVVELMVLLSRAALKGGADINAVLGLNYDYLREIDGFSTIEDIILWLHTVTRRFTQHVFDLSSTKHVDIICKAVDYIKRNYSSKIKLKDIADHLFISQQYFCRIFKEETSQTPGAYITFVRIEESKKLLRNSAINIIDIPELVGFDNQSYFTKIFKKETGFTPGQYRRKNLDQMQH